MGAGGGLGIGKMVNVCKYKASDTPETPRKSLEPDGRWRGLGTGKAVNVCKYKASDTPKTPRESLEPDWRWRGTWHWEGDKCV